MLTKTPPITSLSQLDPNETYTYADYLSWRFTEMVELIKGKILRLAAPVEYHQRISWNLTHYLANYFWDKPCRAYTAPFDVRLKDRRKQILTNDEILTTVQPDLCVICDLNKIDRRGCLGSPDLVVEILSEGNGKKEMKMKFDLYEENEIREYWIVDPEREVLHQFALDEQGKYRAMHIWTDEDTFSAHIFGDLQIDLSKVFTH